MLEGKELEYKIGEYGSASVDVNDSLEVEVAVGIKVSLIVELKKLAAKTNTQLDDQFLGVVEGMLEKIKAPKV